MSGTLAVALHDVAPSTFGRARQIRYWLEDRGIHTVTMLVIPASELHPIGPRAPALVSWLRRRMDAGDVIAQHGLAHRAPFDAPFPRSLVVRVQGGRAAEFPGLDADATHHRVQTGLRVLHDAGLNPSGFVAPGYAYTRELRRALDGYRWVADISGVRAQNGERIRSRALCLGSSTRYKRALSPPVVRAAARAAGPVVRLDIHPRDLDLPEHVAVIEAVLDRAQGRRVVSYDELCGR